MTEKTKKKKAFYDLPPVKFDLSDRSKLNQPISTPLHINPRMRPPKEEILSIFDTDTTFFDKIINKLPELPAHTYPKGGLEAVEIIKREVLTPDTYYRYLAQWVCYLTTTTLRKKVLDAILMAEGKKRREKGDYQKKRRKNVIVQPSE